MRECKTPEDFDSLVTEAIIELSGDDVTKGAECLVDIAKLWAKAGLGQKSFMDMRQYIINEAIERTDQVFIETKIAMAERKLRERRTGSNIILN